MQSVYPHIIPNIEDWPIYKIHKRREAFVKELNVYAKERLLSTTQSKSVHELLDQTIYLEKKRVKHIPWKVDPADDKTYWKELEKEVAQAKDKDDNGRALDQILDRVINRYNQEIVGDFKIKTFKFARKFLTSFFRRLFNPVKGKGQWLPWGNMKHVQQRIHVEGYINEVRDLFPKGKVIIVPTHFSNLDSAIIAYAIEAVVGLPAFSYGAGLNLYDMELVAYFINRLGAYRVDRRKKNPIYLECLKSMASYSVKQDLNQIFFPGGTRSRSGAVEEKLKLGLLGSVIEAQREMLMEGRDDRIFIVPMILGYHFVLEGKYLIEEHLKRQIKEKYHKTKDEGKSYGKLMKFIWSLFREQGDMTISFGQPIDVFGNRIDADGKSRDNNDNLVDISGYFKLDGELTASPQRERVYTEVLGDRIVDSFKKYNVVLSSHFIAYTAFNVILAQNPKQTLYDIMNTPSEDFKIPRTAFLSKMNVLLDVIKKEATAGNLQLSEVFSKSTDEILQHGLSNLGIYHAKKVLYIDKADVLRTGDISLLYFYHNRMSCYDLVNNPKWQREIIDESVLETNQV